ncbi:unnamed protein product [Agarophyton chilense]|eukprot:gb/GEZJ01001653.1/.p1 GENE.gb/GEZJ01001653.1/~~gb/GEZJ01001653.1/.p1  ORF type:complete len:301 (+),score=43.28 gb/GEZJ01001653.1/:225-1127(+)
MSILAARITQMLTLLLTVICFCIVSRCNAYGPTLLIGEVSRRDISKPVYEVRFPLPGKFKSENHPPEDVQPPGFTAMSVVTARGQKMRCLLPELTPSTTPSDDDHVRSENVFDDIDALLADYEDKCAFKVEGWWTYEFCYGKHVAQKHFGVAKDGSKEITDEFVLGYFDKEQDLIRRKNISEVITSDAAFTQLYTGGTTCDMTNKPRQVLVKYMCIEDIVSLPGLQERTSKEKVAFLYSIREVESCVYEIEFFNKAICEHPLYKQKLEGIEKPIHCSLEEGEGPFEGLASETYQKASLNL